MSDLCPARASRVKRKRCGRGESSGIGKTSGKGHKGQKCRSGGSIAIGFEGGQMPLYRRLPKRGFRSRRRVAGLSVYHTISLASLNSFAAGEVVDINALKERGLVSSGAKKRAGVKILGQGELNVKLTVRVHAASAMACKKIEAAGGSVELVKTRSGASLDKDES